MPICHDKKPRCRHRRNKWRKSLGPPRVSARGLQRRLLRRVAENAHRAQLKIEVELRGHGISWRRVEQAVAAQVQGKWSRLGTVLFELPDREPVAVGDVV